MKKTSLGKLFRRYARGTGFAIFFALLMTALSILLSLLSPKIISYAVDSVIGAEQSTTPACVSRILYSLGGR